jgi:F0F1-type ATP synthase epsilon subunit
VSGDEVSLLTDVSEPADGIDVERATQARQAAQAALASDPDDADAVVALRRAELRLSLAGVAAE